MWSMDNLSPLATPTPPTRLRRSIPFLVAGIVLVAGLAVAGFAAAGTAPSGPFTLQHMRVGDQGQYNLTRYRSTENGIVMVSDVEAARFAWGEPATRRGDDGLLHAVNTLAYDEPVLSNGERVLQRWTYLIGQDGVSLGHEHEEQQASSYPGFLPVPVPGYGPSEVSYASRITFFGNSLGRLVCGLAPGALPRQFDLSGPIRVNEVCNGPVHQPAPMALRSIGTAGGSVILRDSTHASSIDLWLSPTLAYPVQWVEEDGDFVVALRLVRFQAGDRPLPDLTDPSSDAAPSLQYAPRLPWGMDDTGSGHPFPLSAAWTHARDDPNAPGMRDFLAAHPDAYTDAAEGRRTDWGDERTEMLWSWRLTDGAASLKVGLVQRTEHPLGQTLPPMLASLAGPSVTYLYANGTGSFSDAAPPASKAPPTMPTVASLAARWGSYTKQPGPLTAWGFLTTCSMEACAAVSSQAWAGRREVRLATTPEALAGMAPSYTIVLDEYLTSRYSHGTTDGAWKDLGGATYASVLASRDVIPLPAALPGGAPPPTPIVSQGAWAVPPLPVLIGLGAVSLAVALAVAWATLKGTGAFALFSRIEDPRLLDHPVRRLVYEAVEANPGIHVQALVRLTGRPRNTVEHHVRKLAAAGLLVLRDHNGYRCCFAKGQARQVMDAAPFLKAPGARQLLAAVRAAPGLSVRQAAAQAGLSPATASYHLQRLEQAGLLTIERTPTGGHLRSTGLADALA